MSISTILDFLKVRLHILDWNVIFADTMYYILQQLCEICDLLLACICDLNVK